MRISSNAAQTHDRAAGPGVILTWLVLAGGLVLFAVGLVDVINFTVDDTFISFRYAENLAAGQGLVFNPGERVEGFSNPLWTLLLSLFVRAGWSLRRSDTSLLVAAKLAGIVFGLATIVLLASYTKALARRKRWGEYSDLLTLAAFCTAATYSVPLWTVSGLETPMCAFFVTLASLLTFSAIARYTEAGTIANARLMAAGVAFGLLSLVRPEQIFIWGVAWLAFLLTAPRGLRSALGRAAVPVLVLYAASAIGRAYYYGEWLPNSVVAKLGGGPLTAVLGLKYGLSGLSLSVGFVALGLLGLPGLVRDRPAWRFLAIYCCAYLSFIVASGGDWMPGFRFFVPVLPVLWMLCTGALLEFAAAARPRIAPQAVLVVVVLLALASFSSQRALVRSQLRFQTGLAGVTWDSSPTRVEVAKSIGNLVPPGRSIALFEAGYVPYYNPQLRVLDDSGLNDRTIARLPGRHMYKMTPEYFLRYRPDYFLTMIKAGAPSADAVALLHTRDFNSSYEPIWTFDAAQHELERARESIASNFEEDLSFVLYRRKDEAGLPPPALPGGYGH
jgi:hypothetical protein